MKPKEKNYSSFVLLAVLSLALIFLGVLPLISNIENNAQELISQRGELSSLQERIKDLREFKSLIEGENSPVFRIESSFFDPKKPVEFIEFLEDKAQSCQLYLDLSPGTTQKVKGDYWPSMTFNLTLTGSPPNFLKFLEKLEQSHYLIEILALSVTTTSQSPEQVKVNLSIKAYTE